LDLLEVHQVTDAELLRLAILKSGLTVNRFAAEIMSRDERTIRRWLAGQPIPQAAKQWLENYTKG
jgi:hypothetical protein